MPVMPPSKVGPLQFSAKCFAIKPGPLSRIPPEVDLPLLDGLVTRLARGNLTVPQVGVEPDMEVAWRGQSVGRSDARNARVGPPCLHVGFEA
jgi:hypothetical protein